MVTRRLFVALLLHVVALHAFRRTTTTSSRWKATKLASTVLRPQFTPQPPHVVDQTVIKQVSLLVSLWSKIAFPTEDDADVDFRLADYGLDRNNVKGFLSHFQNCKDCSADHAFLMATQDDDGTDILKLTNVYFPMLTEEDDDDEWGNFDPELLGDANVNEVNARTVFPVENDDAIVLQDTKEWVRKIIADFGVCPFTIDPMRAGIPMGGVRYTVSRAKEPEEAFFRYWEEVEALLRVTEREMSTVLLVFPELELFGNFELFESYCESLGDALCSSTMCMENEIQLVFFHPKYQFRDGQARSGEEMGAANFARRSPWPMINILRTPQVKAAQKGIPTGVVYKQNEERLAAVGTRVLEDMLYTRNWEGLPMHTQHKKVVRELQEAAERASGAPGVPAVPVAVPVVGVEPTTAAEAGAAAGVCPFPHEQMAAALQSQAQAPAQAQAQAPPSPLAETQPPQALPWQPSASIVDAEVAQVLQAARQRAKETLQLQQEAILAQQRELNLIPLNEARAGTVAGAEAEVGDAEPEVDLLEGISESFLKKTPAPAPVPVRAPTPVVLAAAVSPAPPPAPVVSKPILTSVSPEQADAEAFLDQTASSSPSSSRLVELIQRTDDAKAEGEVWDADFLLLADEVELWLAQEEAARTQQ